jgi:hypothetical protein
MVSKRQFMIVYSKHGRGVQRSQETLTGQEKQEIQSEYKKYRSVDPAVDQVGASTLAVAASRRAADDRKSDSRSSPRPVYVPEAIQAVLATNASADTL